MAWLEPNECTAARDCLKQGNLVEAARVLLGCRNPQHRAVRNLRLEVGQQLARQAEELYRRYEAGEAAASPAAASAIHWAEQCTPLEREALMAKERITEVLERARQEEARRAARLQQAQQWADARHPRTALDVLASLRDYPPAEDLRTTVNQRLDKFRRHLDACKDALQAGQAQVAYRQWQQARKLVSDDDPQLAELAPEIARGMAAAARAPAVAAAIRDRGQRFLLGDLALVVSAGEVCFGSPRAEGVQVPLLGNLHSRHAVFFRDREGWQLAVCRDSEDRPCPVWVEGRKVDTLCRLMDGDRIALGTRQCVGQFRLPVAGSETAVVEFGSGSGRVVWTATGRAVAAVVLLGNELVLRAAPPAHIVLRDLPCQELSFHWEGGGVQWRVQGGQARAEFSGPTFPQPSTHVYLPSRLVIEPQLDEAEHLGRIVAGCEPAPRLVLELADPAAAPRGIA